MCLESLPSSWPRSQVAQLGPTPRAARPAAPRGPWSMRASMFSAKFWLFAGRATWQFRSR
eukprot:12937319-Alexandrium_andersonii.AAC.1